MQIAGHAYPGAGSQGAQAGGVGAGGGVGVGVGAGGLGAGGAGVGAGAHVAPAAQHGVPCVAPVEHGPLSACSKEAG